MITTGQQGLLVSSRMRHFSFLSILYLILLLVIYHIDVSDVGEGLRLFGQLRDEIFLLLHSALQFHYLKVAQTNLISLVGKKDAINDFQVGKEGRHKYFPCLGLQCILHWKLLWSSESSSSWWKVLTTTPKANILVLCSSKCFSFFGSEKIPLKASFVFLVIVPYIRYVNIFFCWCI